MSLKEIDWNAAFKKYNKIEKDLLKIMKQAQKNNDYTMKKLNGLVKENREFECELINMNREMTIIVEKLKEECLYSDAKEKFSTKGKKIQTNIDAIKENVKNKAGTNHRKRRKVKANQETNLSYSQKSINIKDSTSNFFNKNLSSKSIKNNPFYYRGDVSKEIEKKEEQIYKTINWAYEKMKLYEYNRKKQNFHEEKQTKFDFETVLDNKKVILDQLKFMHENLKDELAELQDFSKTENKAKLINWEDDMESYHVEDVIGAFSEFMNEILSQLTSIYFNRTTEKNEIITRNKQELFFKIRDTCVVMKKLFLSITEKLIDNNFEAAFKKGIEESKINETNESIQHIINRLICNQENAGNESNSLLEKTEINIKFSKHEILEQFKTIYENMKKAYHNVIKEIKNDGIVEIKNDKMEVGNKPKDSAGAKPSKIPKYYRNYKPNRNFIKTKLSNNEFKKDSEESNSKSKQNLLKQLHSTYENMTSEYEIIKQEFREDKSVNVEENEVTKSKISVQDVLKQLKETYETMKSEYTAIVESLKDKSLEDKITEEERLLVRLEKAKEKKQEILHRLKSVGHIVKEDFNEKSKDVGKSKWRHRRVRKKLKIDRLKWRFNGKCYTENICGHFVIKDDGKTGNKCKKNNKSSPCNSPKSLNENSNVEQKLVQPRSRYESIKDEYNELTTKMKMLLKRIDQIGENINFFEKKIEDKLIHAKIFKEYTDLREKYENFKSENDILKEEITALDDDKTKIERDMSSLETKIGKFKAESDSATKILLNKLELAYDDLKQNFNERITMKQINILEKIDNFSNNIKTMEGTVGSLEKRVKENSRVLKGTVKDVLKELKLNYDTLKREYNQIISEKKTNIQEEINSLKKIRRKIEKEMSNVELKLKTFQISSGKSRTILMQLKDAYEDIKNGYEHEIKDRKEKLEEKNSLSKTYQSKEEESDILEKNKIIDDYERVYLIDKQIQTTDDKENQINIEDTRKLIEDLININDQNADISTKGEKSDECIENFSKSVNAEEINTEKLSKEKFTKTENVIGEEEKEELNLRNELILSKADEQLKNVIELNRNYFKTINEKVKLSEDVVKRGDDDIIKLAEEQLDRNKTYLKTYRKDYSIKEELKVDRELEDANKMKTIESKTSLEHTKNFDLKEIINMFKQEKTKDIRPLGSIFKMQLKDRKLGRNRNGQESGDKEKLKIVRLPNQILCNYAVESDSDIDKERIVVESVSNLTKYKTEDSNSLKSDKETFKQLRKILMEKSDILENINNTLRRMLGNVDSKPKRKQDNGIINDKQRNLKIINLPSQNLHHQLQYLEPKTTNNSNIEEENGVTTTTNAAEYCTKKTEYGISDLKGTISGNWVTLASSESKKERFETLKKNLDLEIQRKMLEYTMQRLAAKEETRNLTGGNLYSNTLEDYLEKDRFWKNDVKLKIEDSLESELSFRKTYRDELVKDVDDDVDNISWINLKQGIFNQYPMKECNQNLLSLLEDDVTDVDSDLFKLKGNVILKDEVASMVWETVIGPDLNSSFGTPSSRSEEVTTNELSYEQKASLDTGLNFLKSSEGDEGCGYKKMKHISTEDENEKEEATSRDMNETMEITYLDELVSIDKLSEESFIQSYIFEM